MIVAIRILLLFFLVLPINAAALDKSEVSKDLTIVTNDKNKMGLVDGAGKLILPYAYESIRSVDYLPDHFIIQKADWPEDYSYGVANISAGKMIIPMAYSNIEYMHRVKRYKVTVLNGAANETANPSYSMGLMDTDGEVITPFIYDNLKRISNMGDEPTHLAERDGKFGYIHLISGKLMIPVIYDALKIDSLSTDAQGEGVAIAKREGKWGVISTQNKTLVPFDFDSIGDFSPLINAGMLANYNGKQVYLKFDGFDYSGMSEMQGGTALQPKADFVGIGVAIGKEETLYPSIKDILDNSPAKKSDLLVNDEILKINGQDISALELEAIVQLIKGKAGTNVSLTIRRDGKPINKPVVITRDKINK